MSKTCHTSSLESRFPMEVNLKFPFIAVFVALTLSAMFVVFVELHNYFESWISITTFALLWQVTLIFPPPVPSDDGKDDTCVSFDAEERLQSLPYTCSCRYQGARQDVKAWVGNPSTGTFCHLGSKRRKETASGQCTVFYVCLWGQQCQDCQFCLSARFFFLSVESLFWTVPWKWRTPGNLDFHT